MKKALLSCLLALLFFAVSILAQISNFGNVPVPKDGSISAKPTPIPRPTVITIPRKAAFKWTSLFTGQISSLQQGSSANETLALTDKSIYRSENLGKDWTLVFSPPVELAVPDFNRNGHRYSVDSYNWGLILNRSNSNPQTMYLASVGRGFNDVQGYAGSLWKSVNGGRDWQHLIDNNLALRISNFPQFYNSQGSVAWQLAISPRNPNAVFMTGVDGKLFKSLNGGINWIDVTPYAFAPTQIQINPFDAENMYLLDYQKNPQETTDSGSTWHELKYDLTLLNTGSFGYGEETARRWTWFVFDPYKQNRIIALVNSHLVLSEDEGKSWKDISVKLEAYKYKPGIFSEPLQAYKIPVVTSIVFSSFTQDKIFVGTDHGIYQSVDSGKNWTLVFPESTIDFLLSKDETKILALTKLGMFQLQDNFRTVINFAGDFMPVSTVGISSVEGFDSPLYLTKADGDWIKLSNDLRWEWEKNPLRDITYRKGYNPATFRLVQFFTTTDGTSFSVATYESNSKIFKRTPDGGSKEVALPKFEYDWCRCRLALSKSDSKRLYLYGYDKLFTSGDGGISWEQSINNGVSAVSVSAENSSVAYAILTGKEGSLNSVLSTSDGGRRWQAGSMSIQDLAITEGISDPFLGVLVDPRNSNSAYVNNKNAIFSTNDAGQTWRVIARNLSWEINDLIFDHDKSTVMYLATTNGVLRSQDSGKTWAQFSDAHPIYKIISNDGFTLAFGKNAIYKLTDGNTSSLATSKEEMTVSDNSTDLKSVPAVERKGQDAVSRVRNASKAWPSYWAKFSSAVARKDFKTLVTLSAPDDVFFDSGGDTSLEWFKMMSGRWNEVKQAVVAGVTPIRQYDWYGEDRIERTTRNGEMIFLFDGKKWFFFGIMGD